MQAFLPSYLELSLDSFTRSRSGCASQFAGARPPPGVGVFDEQVRQNMALFDRAMKMFSPFAFAKPEEPRRPRPRPSRPSRRPPTTSLDD